MTNPETAVTVIEQSATDAMVEWNLDDFPEHLYNRLLPTQTLMMPTDLLRPVVQIVKLNPDPSAGDVYHSGDMPDGHSAPTRVALRKLATAAGISIIDERRVDDGRDPDVIEVICIAEMLMPTGQRIRATGSKRIDLNAQVWKSPAHRGKYKSFFQEHVASRAQNRAIRALLSMRGSYPAETYTKAFAVVSFAPNMAHPEVRARVLDSFAPAVAQLYGPATAAQLGAGAPVDVTPAPEEDPAPSTPTVLPGERLRAASGPRAAAAGVPEEPDWMRGTPAAEEAQVREAPTLRSIVEARLRDEGQPKGPMNKAQQDMLSSLFAPFGESRGAAFASGVAALFDVTWKELTCAQARAIGMAHDELGAAAFEAAWQELVS